MKHVLLHPTKQAQLDKEMSKISSKISCDLEVHVVSYDELDMLGAMLGYDGRSVEFWNPNNAYILDQVAWDNLTKPSMLSPIRFGELETESK